MKVSNPDNKIHITMFMQMCLKALYGPRDKLIHDNGKYIDLHSHNGIHIYKYAAINTYIRDTYIPLK